MPCSWSTLGAWWFLRGPYKVPRVWYGYHSSSRGSSCHIITLGFSAKDSSDFLQVPWGKGEHRAEACSGQYGKFPSTTPDALPRWCAELSALLHWAPAGLRRAWCTRNCTQIYCEIKFCIPFLSTFLIFLDIFFASFGHFLDLFGLVSPVTHAEIPLSAENSEVLMRHVWHKPYYARHTPKFSAQSCYYTRHIRHNMYFFQSGVQVKMKGL